MPPTWAAWTTSFRRFTAVAILVVLAAASAGAIADPWQDSVMVATLAFSVVAAFGVALRRPWGRWMALACGLGALNAMGWELLREWRHGEALDKMTLVVDATGAVLALVLAGPRMGQHFRADSSRLVRGVRGGLIRLAACLAFSAAPVLLLYGLTAQRVNAEQLFGQGLALCAAALLVTGATLVLRGRTVGALVLATGSFAVLQFAAHVDHPWAPSLSMPSPVLAPAVVAGVVVLAAVAGPAWRQLRG